MAEYRGMLAETLTEHLRMELPIFSVPDVGVDVMVAAAVGVGLPVGRAETGHLQKNPRRGVGRRPLHQP
jgi:hypothetical protein